ncbi:MAG: metal-sulfur cluster assembly factor [Thermoproteota archaeon]|nr:metal-sulfur cluster assembly factor [Candidatus Brockarchaeota archaeon]MBO3768074.1 metal-sulfur cluster assembly factor [Candidatus Brockarchaeota archaeon]MBO3801575.1 metal-sulfur cluster assembly factor [Candidatus Brockarchaeota archaeon]
MTLTEEEKYELKTLIMVALEDVVDPELGVDIVNLGLVYNIEISDNGVVNIKMTLTAIGCPLGELIATAVKEKLSSLDDRIKDINLEITFDPPWNPKMVTEKGRKMLEKNFGYDVIGNLISSYES